MRKYSIKEISLLCGVKPHTLRIWEKRYGILKPFRTSSNIRYYDDGQLRYILNISMLNKNGYKISHLACMEESEIYDKVISTCDAVSEHEGQLELFSMSMLELNQQKFENLWYKSVVKLGVEEVMLEIIFPLFRRIGTLWRAGVITSVHEHFISALVRQKIIAAIDSLASGSRQGAKTFLLFLPEKEQHEIGLLFGHYLLKARGHRVVCLGAGLPLCDIKASLSAWKPDFLFTVFTVPFPELLTGTYIGDLCKLDPSRQVMAAGAQVRQIELNCHNLTVLQSFADAIRFIDNLGFE